jgi:hypothetical protein
VSGVSQAIYMRAETKQVTTEQLTGRSVLTYCSFHGEDLSGPFCTSQYLAVRTDSYCAGEFH